MTLIKISSLIVLSTIAFSGLAFGSMSYPESIVQTCKMNLEGTRFVLKTEKKLMDSRTGKYKVSASVTYQDGEKVDHGAGKITFMHKVDAFKDDFIAQAFQVARLDARQVLWVEVQGFSEGVDGYEAALIRFLDGSVQNALGSVGVLGGIPMRCN